MIMDKDLELADSQAETTIAAHDSDNIINMGAPGDAHEELYAVIQIDDAVESAGAATGQFQLITDTELAFGDAPVTIYDSGALAKAVLVAGYQVVKMRLPKGMKQFIKGVVTIGTAVLTGGSWSMFLVKDIPHDNIP